MFTYTELTTNKIGIICQTENLEQNTKGSFIELSEGNLEKQLLQ